MMKRIPTAVKVVLGMIKGIMSTVTMLGFLPWLKNTAVLLVIVNCAFCIALFTAGDEKENSLPMTFLFWLIVMALTIFPMITHITMKSVMLGFSVNPFGM